MRREDAPRDAGASAVEQMSPSIALSVRDLNVFYGRYQALANVSMDIPQNEITAFIGPSGCGKTTLLKTFNRLMDLVPGARMDGEIMFDGINILSKDVEVTGLRTRIGMVFQRPNPFGRSIYDNVAFGPKLHVRDIRRSTVDAIVQESLTSAGLWDEVKDKLHSRALELSGGQQQRLCIARALAIYPEVLLMDEPTSALDPPNTLRIEELLQELSKDHTIIIVTHSMKQAARLVGNGLAQNRKGMVGFFYAAESAPGKPSVGYLAEYGPGRAFFQQPKTELATKYIQGKTA